MKENILYVTVGVPGSGKSTWVSKILALAEQEDGYVPNLIAVSTDDYIEKMAKSLGLTYSDVFDDYMAEAISNMMAEVRDAVKAGKNVIWDQTSCTVKSRAKKLKYFPGYHKVAVVFPTPERQELRRRLDSRVGKHIPKFVLDSMIKNFTLPTLDEGFDEVIFV